MRPSCTTTGKSTQRTQLGMNPLPCERAGPLSHGRRSELAYPSMGSSSWTDGVVVADGGGARGAMPVPPSA
jgi:hypothetical protein